MKRECRQCGQRKKIKNFRISRVVKNKKYRRYVCNECMDASAIQWRKQNSQKVKQYNQERYLANKELHIQRAIEWKNKNAEQVRDRTKKWYWKLRSDVFSAYGNKCACCGETELLFLSIDHIDGQSYKISPLSGQKLYKFLRENNYPEGFQILCHNCNQGKRANRGICPHQIKEV